MTIQAVIYNDFVINQGVDWSEILGFRDNAGDDIIMTGWTIIFTMKNQTTGQETILSTSNNKIVIFDDDKKFKMSLDEAETTVLDAGESEYQLVSITVGNDSTRRMQGNITVSAEIT